MSRYSPYLRVAVLPVFGDLRRVPARLHPWVFLHDWGLGSGTRSSSALDNYAELLADADFWRAR